MWAPSPEVGRKRGHPDAAAGDELRGDPQPGEDAPSDGDEEADVVRDIMAVSAAGDANDAEVHAWLGREQPQAPEELPLGAPGWDEYTGKALPEADVRASRAE